jgi:hypothetical protein
MFLKSGQRWVDPIRGYLITIDRDILKFNPSDEEDNSLIFPFKYEWQNTWRPGGFNWKRFTSDGDLVLLRNQDQPQDKEK